MYQFKDAMGNIIYVGKAKSLRHRVRSYFGSLPNGYPKLYKLVEEIADLDYIVTENELEAIILESNLIKHLKPKYNVDIKDDKNFPYLKIDRSIPFPRLQIVRKVLADSSLYFGPFVPAKALRGTLSLLQKHFPLRVCKRDLSKIHQRPCLNFQINKCLAPCVRNIDQQRYEELLRNVILFLSGKKDILVDGLRDKMRRLADELRFEEAALIRDQIQAIELIMERQEMISVKLENQDIIASELENNRAVVQVFHVRQGKLIGRSIHVIKDTQGQPEVEILSDFIKQFYASDTLIPPEILLQQEVEDQELLSEWLSRKRGSKVRMHVPQRGRKAKLLDLVSENIKEALRLHILQDERNMQQQSMLARIFGLEKPPGRIECFDISTLAGSYSVGSMVVWKQGKLVPSEYRRFKIETVQGVDDYKMMSEVVKRRFTGSLADKTPIPDLILLDGGKGQLNVAVRALCDNNIDNIKLAAIAKGEDNDLIYLPGRKNPLNLRKDNPALSLLQKIRDESHRFAIEYNRSLRKKATTRSILDEIPGLGPTIKKRLLNQLGSLKAIREADPQALAQIKGVSRKLAQTIYDFFRAIHQEPLE